MAASPHYRHTQLGWVVLVAMALTAVVVGGLLIAGGLSAAGGITVGVLLLVCVLFGSLTITIDDEAFAFHFGVGLIRKRIPLAEITTRQATTTPWYYGWGIRLYSGGWLYNVSGRHSVELWLQDGRRVRVGTDEPDAVLKALDEVTGPARPLTETEAEVVEKRSQRFAVGVGLFVLTITGLVGVMFYVEMRPPTIEIHPTSFTVGSGLYGADIPFAEVKGLSLERSMPEVLGRSNGFAAGKTLRGHFRLEGGVEAELYLQSGHPPFIRIQRKAGDVYLGYEEAPRTRAAFAELETAWRAQPGGPGPTGK
jgi:hypothetical protein